MNTYEDLYNFLKNNKIDLKSWLEEKWEGKDKQEVLLRLFGKLGLINKLNNYTVCNGNFNLKNITKQESFNDIFYNKSNKLINLKDKGDSSDLTLIHNKNDKHLLAITSKNINKMNVDNLDIDKILTNFNKYEKDGFKMSLGICIRDINVFNEMVKNIEYTNNDLKNIIIKEDTIVIDWNDLIESYNLFKDIYGNIEIKNIIKNNKHVVVLRMHQKLGVIKTINMKNDNKNKILWGHIQRSGKSYIMCGTIIEDSKNKDKCNYLIITTAPNETIEQYIKTFNCFQLNHFNIIHLHGNNKNPTLQNKNIIICSKQFLDNKNNIEPKSKACKPTKIDIKRSVNNYLKKDNLPLIKSYNDNEIKELREKYNITDDEILKDKIGIQKIEKNKINDIPWLKGLNIDIRFLDESHNGGTTELAQNTLEYYGKNSFTIQITGTYTKPVNDYNIPKENWILWDLEDIRLCQNIDKECNIEKLIKKHGNEIKDIILQYSLHNIKEEYSKYPELIVLTNEIKDDIKKEIIENTKDNNYGWSIESSFLLKQGLNEKNEIIYKDEFQNENEATKIWYNIFGKRSNFNIPDKNYSDDIIFIKRIEKICKNPTINSRFIGDTEEPMIIMVFLPQNNIDLISKATEKLLIKYNIIPEYEIICINSNTTKNPKQSIEDARTRAKNSNNKKGVLVLSGRQCSLGVSIDNCDIVLLLNNNMSFDMIYQMMFRCMTEGKNKKCGFVVDLNIHRVNQTIMIDYALLTKPDIHPKEGIKYLLQERLINLNPDHWMPTFGNNNSDKINIICENIYNMYSSNTECALAHILERLKFKQILLSKDEEKMFKLMFQNNSSTKEVKELIEKIKDSLDTEEENIKKGIEKTKIENKIKNEEYINYEEEEKEEKFNYMDILKHIIPLICILTIHNKETSFIEMYNIIKQNINIYDILIKQIISWYGKNVDNNSIVQFIETYIKYMKNDKEVNQIIRTVKELFAKNINNQNELSKLIDKYLIPQELEKKKNAEVSTPYKLRQEMLDKMPKDFWKKCNKVIEPCVGKGGFLIDIISRFMDGLKEEILDEKIRYKKIVEECIYFSDINETNIFICKLLIDPYNEYKLNYNIGNTLELDIKKKWNLEKFNAVITNPPYNEDPENSNDPHQKPVYQYWIYKFEKICDYLLFITPSKWFTSDDKLLVDLREYMKKCKIQFIIHYPNDNVFDNVKIKGGVSYYLIDKSFTGNTLFNENMIEINKFDIILEPKYYNLINYIEKYCTKNLSDLYSSQGTYINGELEKLIKTKEDNNSIVCYASQNKGFKSYINKNLIKKKYNYWKVITTAAAYKGTSGFFKIFIGNENEIHSRSYISFTVNSELEAKSLESYLKCKFTHVLLSSRKITHNLTNKNIFKWIPLVPLNKIWSNTEIYKYFNMSDDLIKCIEDIKIEGCYDN